MAKDGLTPKQEKFVQGLFSGLSQREAYKQSYNAEKWKDNSIDAKASELAKHDKIVLRLKELQDEVKERNMITKDWVMEKLQTVVTRSLQETPVLDRNGERTGEYRYDSPGVNKALELIGKEIGMFKEHKENKNFNINADMDADNMTDDEIAAELEKYGFKKVE